MSCAKPFLLVWLAGVFAALLFTGEAWAQNGRWLRAESANFVVYGDRTQEQVVDAAQALEDFHSVLRVLTSARSEVSPNKLEVYLLRDSASLREIWPDVSRDVPGFYIAGLEQTAAFLIYRDWGGVRRNEVLFHEYAHHFMLHYFPQAYPQWYIEGWADFVSTMQVRGRRAYVGIPSSARGRWIVDGGFLPIEHLLAPERLRRQSEDFRSQFYAHAWFAALYLANRPERQRGLQRYVTALGEGADPIDAFAPAFGVTPAQFAEELRVFRSGYVTTFSAALPEQRAEVTVTRLPAVADDLLLPLAQLRVSGVPEDAAATTATRIERLAERHPGTPMAQIALARAAHLRDDYSGATTLLESIIAEDAANTEARYLLADVLLRESDEQPPEQARESRRAARRQLVRGFRDDPNHFPTLFLYASTFADAPQPMNEAQLNVLARALELSPQSERVRLLLAEELIQAGRNDAAVIALRPLIYAPHGGQSAERARALFSAARSATPTAPPVAADQPNDEEDSDEEQISGAMGRWN